MSHFQIKFAKKQRTAECNVSSSYGIEFRENVNKKFHSSRNSCAISKLRQQVVLHYDQLTLDSG